MTVRRPHRRRGARPRPGRPRRRAAATAYDGDAARASCGGSPGCCPRTSASGPSASRRDGLRRPVLARCGGATPTGWPTRRPAADPLRRHDVLAHAAAARRRRAWTPRPRRCSGEHDFAAFCRRREGATTVRTLLGCTGIATPDGLAGGHRARRRVLPLHGAGLVGACSRSARAAAPRPGRPRCSPAACATRTSPWRRPRADPRGGRATRRTPSWPPAPPRPAGVREGRPT